MDPTVGSVQKFEFIVCSGLKELAGVFRGLVVDTCSRFHDGDQILRVHLVVLDFLQVLQFRSQLLHAPLLHHSLAPQCGDLIRGPRHG